MPRGATWLAWLLPIVAAAAIGALGLQRLDRAERHITIRMASAGGLEAGRSVLRYRGRDIGRVSRIRLAADRTGVIAEVTLGPAATGFTACDARFWVVQPRLDWRGASGLATMLSGAYLAADVGRAAARCRDFVALAVPPAVMRDERGRTFSLRAASLGSLTIGAPVYFEHVPVGRVSGYALARDGGEVRVQAFVRAPFDARVTANTQWWQASGVDLRLDSAGVKLNVESLAAALTGGVAFSSPAASGSAPAPDGARFVLSDSAEAAARRATDGPAARVAMRFGQSLRDLSVGAPVEFHGIALGTVLSVEMALDPATATVSGIALLELYPARLGTRYRAALGNGDSPDGKALLRRLVAQGLRGQLRTGNLLTGQQYIDIDFFPNAPAAPIDTTRARIVLPTVPGAVVALRDQLAALSARLDAVPAEAIGRNAEAASRRAASLLRQWNTALRPEAGATAAAASQAFAAAGASAPAGSARPATLHDAIAPLKALREAVPALPPPPRDAAPAPPARNSAP
ncbi:MAG: MlaD family protein [Burkholderia sp.]